MSNGVGGWIRVALVDLRGGTRRFVVLLACLALGTCTIAAVDSVGAALQEAVVRDATTLMGGDLEASRSDRRATADELAFIQTLGPVSEADDSNGRALNGDNTAFLDVAAVDDNYPLFGRVKSPQLPNGEKPGTLLALKDGAYGAIIDPVALDRLGIQLGGEFFIGATKYQARGVLASLPDGAVRGFHLGLTALISVEALAATPDARPPMPGMLTLYRYKVALPQGQDRYDVAAAAIAAKFNNDPRWKTRSPRIAAGDLARYYDTFTRFLIIVGLSALLVGGVGVSNAVSAYISERQRAIATMRSLGATSARIMVHFMVQLGILSAIGVLIGVTLGAISTAVALPFLGQLLSVDLPPSVDFKALATAIGFGMLIAFGFSFLPLTRAQKLRPATLFRSVGGESEKLAWREILRPSVLGPLIITAVLVFLLAVVTTNDLSLVTKYALGVIAAFLLLRFAGFALQLLLRLVPPLPNAAIRNGLKSIVRPGSPAPVVILSLGLGLAMLLMIGLLASNLRSQLQGEVTRDAPSFVATDLFPDEVADLQNLAKTDKRIDKLVAVPSYSGKVTAVKGVPSEQIKNNAGEEVAFLLGPQIPITWTAAMPEGSTVVSGQWWPNDYNGPPLLSLRTTTAAALGVKVGDKLDFDLYNQKFTATLANIRDYKFQSMAMNFLVTFSPHALDGLPGSLMAGLKTVPGQEKPVERQLARDYSQLTFIPIGDALNQAASILDQLSVAVDVVGGLAVINGILVLAGTMAAGRHQREADAIVSKVLGATRSNVISAFTLEYGLLGAFSAILAAIIAIVGAWAITPALDVSFSIDVGLILLVIIGSVLVTIATGAATTWSALSSRPAQFLRTE